MGEFYFDSYTNNSDKTTTLVGKNIIKQLETATIVDGLVATDEGYFLDRQTDPYKRTFKGIIENSGYPIDIQLNSIISSFIYHLQNVNMPDFIKSWCLLQNALFLGDRNNNLTIKNINFNNVDNLSKNELLNDVSFSYIDKINTLKKIKERRESTATFSETLQTYTEFDNYAIAITKPTDLFVIEKQSTSFMSTYTTTFTNGTGTFLWDNQYFLIARINGTPGETVYMTCTKEYYYTGHNTKTLKLDEGTFTTKKENEKENMIEVKDQIGYGNKSDNYKNLLNYAPSYEISFDYNGDPSLEAGDYINVETPYGYKPVFIQKNKFKFNGGLQGSIEGVE